MGQIGVTSMQEEWSGAERCGAVRCGSSVSAGRKKRPEIFRRVSHGGDRAGRRLNGEQKKPGGIEDM